MNIYCCKHKSDTNPCWFLAWTGFCTDLSRDYQHYSLKNHAVPHATPLVEQYKAAVLTSKMIVYTYSLTQYTHFPGGAWPMFLLFANSKHHVIAHVILE